jgi:hypothetical protein
LPLRLTLYFIGHNNLQLRLLQVHWALVVPLQASGKWHSELLNTELQQQRPLPGSKPTSMNASRNSLVYLII